MTRNVREVALQLLPVPELPQARQAGVVTVVDGHGAAATTTATLLRRLFLYDWFSLWWGQWQRLE